MVSTVQDPDILNLSSVLVSLENDLSLSYLQSRPLFENDLNKQVEHALNEIINRERDLRASIGISKFLLNSYSALNKTHDEVLKENENLTQQFELLTRKLDKAKPFKERFYETEQLLEEAEKELKMLKLKPESLLKDKQKKGVNLSYDCISLDRFSAELTDMDNKYRDEYNAAVKAKIDAENRCIELESRLKHKSNKLSALKCKTISHLRMSTDIESNLLYKISIKDQSGSVTDEFDCELGSSAFSFCKNLDVCKQETIFIEGKEKEKFTDEIYFWMTLNVVKLNNDYLSSVNVDYHELYLTALSQNVPLHKWIYWIESQLNIINTKLNQKVRIKKTH